MRLKNFQRALFVFLASSTVLQAADVPALSPEVRKTAEALREKAFAGTKAADWVRSLTDEVGPRLSGSPQDAVGVAWALATLKAAGFTNVHAEKVMVPAWQRGVETGEVTAPYKQKLVLAALGGSPPTPEGGLEAEIVLLGAHRDSWDLGTGAIDDAAGCGIVIEAARLIGLLPKHPPRTIRVCLYASEENGIAGGKAYFKTHQAELAKHAAALESDSGTDYPIGFAWTAGPSAEPFVKEVAAILEPLGAGTLSPGGAGADTGTLKIAGVPMFAVRQDSSRYFDYHHTANDTFDKIDPEGLDRNVAAVAAFAYCAASTPEMLERIPPDKRAEPRRPVKPVTRTR